VTNTQKEEKFHPASTTLVTECSEVTAQYCGQLVIFS